MFTVLYACNDDVLDIQDISNYNPDLVWNDENLAMAYLTNIYPMFGNHSATSETRSQQLTGIFFYDGRVTITNGNEKNWNYSRIRLLNQAIVDVESGNLKQSVKDNIVGQALFMRAYTYFNMLVYHGGVPYIKVPQDRYKDDLYVTRNTSAECFQYIIEDLDKALELLPETISKTSGDYGKIDGSFALAFKAKVLLQKASPQFNPSNKWNNSFWADAYSVNKKAYTDLSARGYALTSNYKDAFMTDGNSEVVFAVINSYPNKSRYLGIRAGSESRGPAGATPTWEFVKEFPMKDGKLYNDPTSAYFKSDDDFMQAFWENRDPRFDQSVVCSGALWELSGKKGRRQYTALGVAHELDDFGVNPAAGINSENLGRYSGFFIRKFVDNSLLQSEVLNYDIDYNVMRFAEVMLNYAEAANETGNSGEALDMLYQIRQRAGIEPGANNKYGITATTREEIREAIIAERNIEFCFEGHRYWDLRRLRMLDRLDAKTKHGLESIAKNADNTDMPISEARIKANDYELTEADFKYSELQVPASGVQVTTIPDTYYFYPIQQSNIDLNEKIEQNNNWGGTFNPTLE